jgi:hypothetical protein
VVVADYETGAPVNRDADWSGGRTGETAPSWLGPQPRIDYEPDRTAVEFDPDTLPAPEPTPVPALQLDRQPRGNGSAMLAEADADEAAARVHFLGALARAYDVPEELLRASLNGLDQPEPDRRVQEWSLPNTENTAVRVLDGPELPEVLDYAPPPGIVGREALTLGGDVRYGVRYVEGPEHGDITVSQDTPRRTGQGDAIGASAIPGLPTLTNCEPPAEPRTRWPMREVARLSREGWRVALPPERHSSREYARVDHGAVSAWHHEGPPLKPRRECARCGATTQPTLITAYWPADRDHGPAAEVGPMGPILDLAVPSGEGFALNIRRMTKLCCRDCRLPYPGPVVVPLYRPPSDRRSPDGTSRYLDFVWHFAALVQTSPASAYWHVRQVSPEALDRVAEGVNLEGLVWGDVYRGVQEGASRWGCALPGCDAKPYRWVRLAGAMAWRGWLWSPEDGHPLRMGLCPEHYHHMAMDLQHALMERELWRGGSLSMLSMRDANVIIP